MGASLKRQLEGRREFLASLTLIGAALATQALSGLGCGSKSSGGSSSSDASTPVSGGDCGANGSTPNVAASSDGHGHTSPVVAAADVSAGVAKTYTLGTSSSHSHTFTVSSANFTTLKGNQGIQVTTNSDSTGHTHTVTINCVGSSAGAGGW